MKTDDIRKRVRRKLKLTVADLIWDPNDFFDNLSAEEFAYIQRRLLISVSVEELPE